MKKQFLVTLVFVTALSYLIFAQGPLVPDEAPAPSMKTLEQVEPRIDLATVAGTASYRHIINVRGSYYLSEDLDVTENTAVKISVSDVTLDLNGFRISHDAAGGSFAILIDAGLKRIKVHNGSIGGFNFGVYCNSVPAVAEGCYFRDLIVTDCIGVGIISGRAGKVSDCRLIDCDEGIHAYRQSIIERCTTVRGEASYSIFAEQGCVIRDCEVYEFKGSYGYYTLGRCQLSGCAAYSNEVNYAIYALDYTSLTDCVANDNLGTSTASYGIYTGAGSSVIRCQASKNWHSLVDTTSKQGVGIFAGGRSLIKDCTATGNRGDGIRFDNSCRVIGNISCANGNSYASGDGAGIHAIYSGNRIESNHVSANDRGIHVDLAQNLIIRNSANGNFVNYEIAENNKVGFIVVPPNSGPVSGNTGGSGVGSTDPWANFTF